MFADLTLTELAPILSIYIGMLVGFYGLVKFLIKNATRDRENDRTERKEFVKAIKNLTASGDRQAQATEKAATEAEKRNGHLAELTIQSKNDTLKAIAEIKLHQKVKEQSVEHQTIKNRE
jgi:hypothetical protein